MRRTLLEKPDILLPRELKKWLRGGLWYDSSCSREARVCFIEKEEGFFLKISPAESLKMEAAMTAYYHQIGLGAEMLYYGQLEDKDYLLTRRLAGEDCTFMGYRSEPERLCETTATLLRALHEQSGEDCPVPNRNESYGASVLAGLEKEAYEEDLFKGLWEFASFEEAAAAARDGLASLQKEVLLHGDYCLPNIILKDWQLSGYVDVGQGGIGDRHIDILWGIWTLHYNLKTTRYTERFMDAYGRDKIDPEKLRCLAAMEMIGG